MLLLFLMSQHLSTPYSKVCLAKHIVSSTSINRFHLNIGRPRKLTINNNGKCF